MEHILLW